ncbi:MAG TPA: hypothetical protein ENK85_04320 [Saprospiraceae bacterium]|nr:hypothetical protein [Saprospiraceae bacterium]
MGDNVLETGFFEEEIIPISENYQRIGRLAGQNNRQILVILRSSQYEISDFAALLHKILDSVQLNHERDVLIFALTSPTPFSLIHLAKSKNCQKAIIFGVPLPELGIHKLLPKYQVESIGDLSIVVSDSFPDLEADLSKKLKMALWKALQVLVAEKKDNG